MFLAIAGSILSLKRDKVYERRMHMKSYAKMSDAELRTLAGKRHKGSGCYTEEAIKAQRELWERSHWDTKEEYYYNAVCDNPRSIEDIQYNG